jgi:hypothetical protein
MARKFLTPIDLNKLELQNAAIQNLATAPNSPSTGQVYYDTVDGNIKVWKGSAWANVSGVTSLVGTADEVTVSASVGAVTLSLPATINANTTGTAAALTTARNIALTGDVTGTLSFDGSASASMVTTVVGGGGGGTIVYQDDVPTAGIETGTLWVDKNGESNLLNGNDFYTKTQIDTNTYTKTQVDGLLSGAGFNPFLLMGA